MALTMVPLSQLEAVTEVARTAVAALLAAAALSRGQVRPAELGQFAWLTAFDDDDRAEFFSELRDALAVAEATRDAAPVETCLGGMAHHRAGAVRSAGAGDPDRARGR